MTQHFLLSAAARTLSVAKVARMSDEEARGVFRKIRWAETDGEAVCPHCGCCACYEFKSARRSGSAKLVSSNSALTSGTLFASAQAADPRLSPGDRDLHQWRQGRFRSPGQPGYGCPVQDGFRAERISFARRWTARTCSARSFRRRGRDRRRLFRRSCEAGEPERRPQGPPSLREPERQAPLRRGDARAQGPRSAVRGQDMRVTLPT